MTANAKVERESGLLEKLKGAFRFSDPSVWLSAIGLAGLFAVAQVLGWRMDQYGNLGGGGYANLALLCLEAALCFLVFAVILVPLLHFSKKTTGLATKSYRGLWALSPIRRRFAIIGVLVIAWFPYWLLLWPGVVSRDSFNQLIQALGLTGYSDHHPIMQTLVTEAFLRPLVGVFGDINVALSGVTLVQLLVLAALLGLCVDTLREFRVPGWVITSTLALFALHPLMGWYSVTMWKDVWLGAFVLCLATVATLIVFRSRTGERISWRLWALLVLLVLAVLFAKKTGLFLVIPVVLLGLILFRGVNRVKWLGCGVVSLLVYLGLHGLLMGALDVKPGSEVEAWSLPSQQIARVAHAHGSELSVGQNDEINRFFSGVDIAQEYKPYISDPIKGSLDVRELQSSRAEFLQLWFELGLEFPGTYLEAALASTYGYWYPGAQYWMVGAVDWTSMVKTDAAFKNETLQLLDGINQERALILPHKQLLADEINVKIRQIPLIGGFFSIGTWVWLAVLLIIVAGLRKQGSVWPVATLAVMVWGTCMISPVYAEARYAYPILLLLPLLGAISYLKAVPSGNHTPVRRATSGNETHLAR